MKHSFRILSLLAAMLMLAGCEKPEGSNTGVDSDNSALTKRVIVYAVGDSESRLTLETEAEWDAMLEQFCNQAVEGEAVTFFNIETSHAPVIQTKEAPAITTTNRDDLKQWMKQKEKEGLTVRVTYDNQTGTWHGEAYATAPTNNTLGTLPGTWHFSCMVVTQFDPDGNLLGSDLYVPEDGGGTMYYTFSDNGTVTLTMHGLDGTTVTDSSTWSLSDDGILSSDLLPHGTNWNVNWITANTMIISSSDLNTTEGDLYYQLQFDRE